MAPSLSSLKDKILNDLTEKESDLKAALKHSKILITDDDEDQLKMYTEYLGFFHAKDVTTTTSPLIAIQMAAQKNYNMVISDLEMPDMNGDILLQKLRELPGYEDIPYVLCSGFLKKEDLFLALEFSIGGFLVKPFTIEKFIDELKIVLCLEGSEKEIKLLRNQVDGFIKSGQQLFAIDMLYEKQGANPEKKVGQVILELLGDCYESLGDYKKAESHYLDILAKNPKDVRVTNKLIKNLFNQEKVGEAIQRMESQNLLSPNNIGRHVKLANHYLDADDIVKAEKSFEKVMSLDQTNQEAKNGLGKVYFSQGEYAKGINIFRHTEQSSELATYFNNLGIGLVKKRKFEEAIKLYCNAISVLSDSEKIPSLLFNIGLAYYKANQPKKGISFFKVALDKMPDYKKTIGVLQQLFQLDDDKGELEFGQWLAMVDTKETQKIIDSNVPGDEAIKLQEEKEKVDLDKLELDEVETNYKKYSV